MKSLVSILGTIFLSACTVSNNELTKEIIQQDDIDYQLAKKRYEDLYRSTTPSSWGVGKRWLFVYIENDKIIEKLVLEPTNTPAFDEQYQNLSQYKKIRIISRLSQPNNMGWSNVIPGYSIDGNDLHIDLAVNISHTDWVAGFISENGFIGELYRDTYMCDVLNYCEEYPTVNVFGVPLTMVDNDNNDS